MTQETKTIEFGRQELDPSAEAAYKQKIASAKASMTDAVKGHTPLGHVQRPNFPVLAPGNVSALPPELDNGVSPRPPGSPSIRPETVEKIEKAMAQATADNFNTAKEEAAKEEEDDALYDSLTPSDRGDEANLVLTNKKRRKEIESRCSEILIDDLILKGEVQQQVVIIPGKLVVTFRSTLPEESLFIKKIIAQEKAYSDTHTLEQYGLLQLCCSLVQVNDVRFDNHLNSDGIPQKELFDKKMKKVMQLSGYLINDLMLNLRWFDIRVRKLLNPEKLGNG